MQYVDCESLLADFADSSVAVVNFMAARYLSASVSLENCADELFEEILTGRSGIDLAGWLGSPIAGQPADIEFVENFHAPAEGDDDMAVTPADSEATIQQRRKYN
eukprot:8082025-Pyramimonas_sp.AAC.1